MTDDTVEKIRERLFRLAARPEDAGREGLIVTSRPGGEVSLDDTRPWHTGFWWIGPAEEALQRLSDLPGGVGAAAVRAAFVDTASPRD